MRSLTLFAFAGLAACSGEKTTSPTGETGTPTDTDTQTTPPAGGFTVEGIVLNAATQQPVAEGLCVSVVDPTPALGGGEPLTLVSGTVGAGGVFSLADVSTTSTVGLLVDVRDCTGDTVYPSATGISADDYAGLGEGDVLGDRVAFSIDAALRDGLAASATVAGYVGDLSADGYFFGFTLDTTGAPLGGVSVSCLGTCNATLYMDTDPADGLFTTGGAPNTATDATAGAVFVIGAAPIGQYSADDGGAHTFGSQLNGSNPGIATITAFYGE